MRRMNIVRTLQREIRATGLSRNRVAKASGVNQTTINKMMNSDREPKIPAIEALCDYLGIVLVKDGQRRVN